MQRKCRPYFTRLEALLPPECPSPSSFSLSVAGDQLVHPAGESDRVGNSGAFRNHGLFDRAAGRSPRSVGSAESLTLKFADRLDRGVVRVEFQHALRAHPRRGPSAPSSASCGRSSPRIGHEARGALGQPRGEPHVRNLGQLLLEAESKPANFSFTSAGTASPVAVSPRSAA